MDLRKPLRLQMFLMDEQEAQMEGIGIDVEFDYDSQTLRPTTFYSVDWVAPHEPEPNRTSILSVGGESYVVKIGIHHLEEMIERHR